MSSDVRHITSTIKVKGTYFYAVADHVKSGHVKRDVEIVLSHNPNNRHDSNAVEVKLGSTGAMLGHVSKDMAPKYAALLLKGAVKRAKVSSVQFENGYIDLRVSITYIDQRTTKQTGHVSAQSLPSTPGVYGIENIRTGWLYIGSSKNVKLRAAEHLKLLKRESHPNSPLQADFNKYGINTFQFILLISDVDVEQLVPTEKEMIEELWDERKNLYNMTHDGQGVARGLGFTASLSTISQRGTDPRRLLDEKNFPAFLDCERVKRSEQQKSQPVTSVLIAPENPKFTSSFFSKLITAVQAIFSRLRG